MDFIEEIEMAIITLENYNKIRQELCSETFEQADEIWKASGMRDNAIVLFNKDWHIGIVGIVASKFVEKYYKPSFIMTYHEQCEYSPLQRRDPRVSTRLAPTRASHTNRAVQASLYRAIP